MGNRGNIIVQGSGSEVCLYSHWDGYGLLEIAARALDSREGRNRWTDPQYLARIVFCEMLRHATSAETGYGISSTLFDGDIVVVIDTDRQRANNIPFEQFIKLPKGLA